MKKFLIILVLITLLPLSAYAIFVGQRAGNTVASGVQITSGLNYKIVVSVTGDTRVNASGNGYLSIEETDAESPSCGGDIIFDRPTVYIRNSSESIILGTDDVLTYQYVDDGDMFHGGTTADGGDCAYETASTTDTPFDACVSFANSPVGSSVDVRVYVYSGGGTYTKILDTTITPAMSSVVCGEF
jgi:hypothetical protein